jgi:hypothetical protein
MSGEVAKSAAKDYDSLLKRLSVMARRNSLKDEWKFESEMTSDKQSLAIESIALVANQPRRYFDPDKLRGLTESVRQHGILEPILVRPSEKMGCMNWLLVSGGLEPLKKSD